MQVERDNVIRAMEIRSKRGEEDISRGIARGCVLLLLTATLVILAPTSFAQQEEYKFSVSVERVVLDVSVRRQDREALRGLPKSSFHVYEDGRLQEITSFESEDAPVAIGLVIDNSRSMRHKRAEVADAALAFINSSNPGDEFFVVNFDDRAALAMPAGRPFSSDPAELRKVVSENTADGKTALYDAILLALEHLGKAHLERRELIIISDGGDNASRHTFQQVLTLVRRSNAGVYSIALADPDALEQNIPALRKLSVESGGEFVLQPELKDIDSTCRRIARDIRMQYTLGYSPTNKAHDGAYRRIHVVVDSPGGKITVLTRPGYLAPSKPAQTEANHGGTQTRRRTDE